MRVEFVRVSVPVFEMAPPLPPPVELPRKVELVTIRLLGLLMAPPLALRKTLEVLPLKVQLLMVSAPPLKMPPPFAEVPLAMVSPEIVTLHGAGILNTCRAWLPLTVMTESPGPARSEEHT